MLKKIKLKTKEEIEEIVNVAIKENHWDTLTSKDYEEYLKVTDIGKEIVVNGKKLRGKDVNDLLEEMKFITRNGKKIILTEEGKKYGRYAISIVTHSTKPIIQDKGYAIYKKTIIQKIKEYLEVKAVLEENNNNEEDNKNGTK